MIVEALLGMIYGVVALIAMMLTGIERSAKGIDGDVQRLAGLVACAVWPFTVVAIMTAVTFAAWRDRNTPARSLPSASSPLQHSSPPT